MGKKIVVVNAGPRKGWNTDTLLTEASKGAESTGAEIERFDLFHLEKYTGCRLQRWLNAGTGCYPEGRWTDHWITKLSGGSDGIFPGFI